MKRTFVCASSCIKQYVQPCIWLPWDAGSCWYVCLYYIKCNYKKYWNKNENIKKMKKSRDTAAKRTDTREVGISSMRKSIYLLTTTPSSHTHRFHPLPLATPDTHTFNLCKVKSMDDNCGEWVECMGVAGGCGEQEAGVARGSGRNLWVWLLGVVVRRYIDFLILLILYLFFFAAASHLLFIF